MENHDENSAPNIYILSIVLYLLRDIELEAATSVFLYPLKRVQGFNSFGQLNGSGGHGNLTDVTDFKNLTNVTMLHRYGSRSSHQRCSVRKGVLGNFAKFTGKHLCQSLFLIKLQALGLQLY